ncbi:MAG: Glu-tRNA(Gln) amidotransferase subunit GatE [Candidatus Diapherotrites archaeon]|uniref:Glutamyl-tRNA(Gln) amidotransferase subunit E n=1 Tax=Candidatus Iainarchaeum sp. TaxID=3101447 RepID=A0A8T4L417_9ARCH|nr:Glu-tRNA(Gln) amidotransferase subunit GatE [Candidatus Diapherotrites archaeon]
MKPVPKLKCGLEVHQQLDTGKLFSRTPGELREEKPDFVIKRRLRPVASELGEFDAAALEQYRKGLEYWYECYKDSISLVETDDEPPQPMNERALDTILTVGVLCNSTFVDKAFVMRKTVIDGSNTSGFQRTALICLGGELDIGNKKIRLQAMALEEDAARPMEKTDFHIVYRLDRLGIPLIELSTEPDIETPEEAKAAALAIGTLFRRTCNAKRGLGTIRQDLNISIEGGNRIEIKGMQDLELIDEFVRREMQRQEKLLEVRDELQKKRFEENDFRQPVIEVTGIFGKTECKFLAGKTVFGVRVPKFKGFFGREIQPNRRVGTEVANYVKTKTGLKGILHSDELPGYGVSDSEVSQVRHALSCQEYDGFVMVSSEKTKAQTALAEALNRCQQCLSGVPPETRQALEDGNTEYLRPLPGAARMYPETDLAPIDVLPEKLSNLRSRLPLSPDARVGLYVEKGLSRQLAEKMKLDNWACFFESLIEKDLNPTFCATVLLETWVELKRENVYVERIPNGKLVAFFELEKKGRVLRDNAKELLKALASNPSQSVLSLVESHRKDELSDEDILSVCDDVVSRNMVLVSSKKFGAIGPLMGDVMKQLRGRVSGERVSAALKKAIEKRL